MPQNYQVNPRRLEMGGHGLGRPPLERTTQGGCGRTFPEAGEGNLLAGEAHPGAPLMGPSTQSCQDLHGLRTKTTWGSVPSRLGCVLHLPEEDSEFSVSTMKWSQQGGDELPTSVPAGDKRSTWEPVMIPGACALRVSSEHHLAATTPCPYPSSCRAPVAWRAPHLPACDSPGPQRSGLEMQMEGGARPRAGDSS